MTVSEFAHISTTLGLPVISPTVMVVNDGDGSGSFANIGCTLSSNQNRIEFSVPTINIPQGFGTPMVSQAFVGGSLEPNGMFLNSVNCRPRDIDAIAADSFAELQIAAQAFFRSIPGFNCNVQYIARSIQLPKETSNGLEQLFDRNFFLLSENYLFEMYVSDLDGKVVGGVSARIALTENAIERLKQQKSLLKFGFGTVCPPPPETNVEVLLKNISVDK